MSIEEAVGEGAGTRRRKNVVAVEGVGIRVRAYRDVFVFHSLHKPVSLCGFLDLT